MNVGDSFRRRVPHMRQVRAGLADRVAPCPICATEKATLYLHCTYCGETFTTPTLFIQHAEETDCQEIQHRDMAALGLVPFEPPD